MASRKVARNGGWLHKLARLSGLIGVALVFAANFLNDYVVAGLQVDRQNVDAVQTDAEQTSEMSKTGLDQLKAADRISQLEVAVARVSSGSRTEEIQSIVASYSLYYSTLGNSVTMLKDSLDGMNRIAENRIALSDETRASLQEVGDTVDMMAGNLAEKNTEFDELKEAWSQADEGSEDEQRVEMQMEQTLEAFSALEKDYTTISTNINELFTRIEEEVASEQRATEETAGVFEGLVYVLSAVGAGIAGLGNWLGGQAGSPESAVPSEPAMGV
jgi:hypothetical protein